MPRAPELSVLAMLSDVVGQGLKAGQAACPARGYARRFAIPGWVAGVAYPCIWQRLIERPQTRA
jgi:hypothetical protein